MKSKLTLGAILVSALGLLASAASAQLSPEAAPLGETVQVEQGTLRGSPRDAGGVVAFKGIPYAAAPIGDLRWQAPQSAQAWQGARDATSFSNRCWSTLLDAELGDGGASAGLQSEDCLSLSVWTGARSSGERRPVMVWIHGGGFQFGTSRNPKTDGALLARKGVILVSLNYRLGVFGFFAHPRLRQAGAPSGNFGLQDQITALKWIKANIANFGGDPSNVTIFGESAGSVSVSFLMASPLAKGLFQRAIGQSGAAPSALPSLAEIGIRGVAFTGALGAKSVEQLRATPAERINNAAAWDFRGGLPIVFAPSTDGYVVPTTPNEVFRAGDQNDVPLLAGYNKREEFPFMARALPHRTAAEFRAAAQKMFGPARMQEFLSLYPSDTDAAAKDSAEALLGDLLMRSPTWRWLDLQSQTGKSPVYGYEFSYQSPYSPIASHVAEIPFIFGNFVPQFFAPDAPPASPADRTVSDALMSYWVNFATKGDPNGPGLPRWPGFKAGGSMLRISEDGRITASPDEKSARYKFMADFMQANSRW